MTPAQIFIAFSVYTILLFIITWFTSRKATNETFFIGEKRSPWYIVAYGMIGASLSGVTFMSVPGWVGTTQFSYLMVVFGYFFGYVVIATVLMPLYYKLNLTSIYTYLEQRFGFWSYKTGAVFFIISRVLGAALRMFLVVLVLQEFIFDAWNIPFIATTFIFIVLIILYTVKGGIRTIIYTDTLQTTFMLLAVIITIGLIVKNMNIGFFDMISIVEDSDYSTILITDWTDKRFFLKNFFSGMFITIVMTGLDQEMMQKNLSCKNIGEAKKNMFTFSVVLIVINLMFLFLGAVLYLYSNTKGLSIPERTDELFPTLAINHLGPFAGLVFVIGLISAAYPSADGALTSLTTSFSIDIIGMKKRPDWPEEKRMKIRKIVHLCFAALFLLVVVILNAINNEAIIDILFTVAGYTYGPLLGMYAFGLFTKYKVRDKYVTIIAIASPIICYVLSVNSEYLFNGYKFGFELLILNGLITFLGMLAISNGKIKIELKREE